MHLKAYHVYTQNLPEALDAMNYNSHPFSARVISVSIFDDRSVVLVEHTGSYPFVENEWREKIIIPTEP